MAGRRIVSQIEFVRIANQHLRLGAGYRTGMAFLNVVFGDDFSIGFIPNSALDELLSENSAESEQMNDFVKDLCAELDDAYIVSTW